MTTAGALADERQGRLVLRAWPWVILAMLAGPIIALTSYWAMITISAILSVPGEIDYDQLLAMWLLILVFGGGICLLVELVVVVPLLVSHHRFRWGWLNGWTGALIGFACGALPFVLLNMITDAIAPGSSYSVGSVDLVVDGHRTLAGWIQMMRDATMAGAVGAISAGVFRVIAVRRV